jgi:hypothetical protein
MSTPTTHTPPAVSTLTAGVLALLTLVGAVALAMVRLEPPTQPPGRESGWDDAAWTDLQRIASEPRPRGSPAHAAAREYLVEQLDASGWDVKLLAGRARSPWRQQGEAYEVVNVLARRAGTLPVEAGGKSLLLMAHYDTKRVAPGAGDDGSGVVTLLHVARKLAAMPPTRNDVLILLTDGEEEGLLGAVAFFEQQTDPATIGAVLNFEGRGSRGPVILFETSGAEGPLLDVYAAEVDRPVTSSFASDLYRVLPNATDFTISLRRGVPGLNFAFVGGWMNYHRETDTIENLSPATLRHHLVHGESLVPVLANADLSELRRAEPRVFFDVLSGFVVRYPAWYALPLAIAGAMMLVAICVWGAVIGRLRAGRMLLAAGAGLGALVLNVLLAWGVVRVVPGAEMMRNEPLAVAGFVLLAVAVLSTLERVATRRLSTAELAAGSLSLLAVLAITLAAALRGGSYLLLIPLVGGTLALAAMIRQDDRSLHPLPLLLLLATTFVVAVVATPVIYLTHLATIPNVVPPWDPRFPLAPFAAVLTTLVLIGLLPMLRLLAAGHRFALPVLTAILAAASFLVATAPWSG